MKGNDMKFRKKPVVIEATHWDGSYSDTMRIGVLFPKLETASMEYHRERNSVSQWRIKTLEGSMHVHAGDWIIKGVQGEFYPIKPDIFAETYEPVENQ